MTDKQIIIDGVDVSGCSYHYKHTRVCLVKMDAAGRYYNCANWHDCDFKKLSQKLKAKEQECEELKERLNCNCFDPKSKNNRCISYNRIAEDYERDLQQLDQLKAEVKSKTEYIQEQREIIDQYSKEIEMYKKCQGKRASKREEELKTENDNLKSLIWWIHVGAEGADKATTEYYENKNTPYEENYWKRIRALQPPTYESKYKLALTEIKEIANRIYSEVITENWQSLLAKQILQKISEVEDANI